MPDVGMAAVYVSFPRFLLFVSLVQACHSVELLSNSMHFWLVQQVLLSTAVEWC